MPLMYLFRTSGARQMKTLSAWWDLEPIVISNALAAVLGVLALLGVPISPVLKAEIVSAVAPVWTLVVLVARNKVVPIRTIHDAGHTVAEIKTQAEAATP